MKATKSYITLTILCVLLTPQTLFAAEALPVTKVPLTTPAQPRLTPAEALDRLMDGNKRFVENKMVCSDKTQVRRTEIADKQTPFAIVVGCSDSRVSPEFAFDQGLGDIFVVRTAGNPASPVEIDSIEYSIEHNHSSIIIVLGHQNCGAVKAIYDNNDQDIPKLSALMKPAIDKVKRLKNNTLEDAVIANVRNSMARIIESPIVGKYIKNEKVQMYGAYYDLESGKISLLPESGL